MFYVVYQVFRVVNGDAEFRSITCEFRELHEMATFCAGLKSRSEVINFSTYTVVGNTLFFNGDTTLVNRRELFELD